MCVARYEMLGTAVSCRPARPDGCLSGRRNKNAMLPQCIPSPVRSCEKPFAQAGSLSEGLLCRGVETGCYFAAAVSKKLSVKVNRYAARNSSLRFVSV